MRYFSTLLTFAVLMSPLQRASNAQTGAASQNYYQAVGYVVAEIRLVKWMEELCSDRFPDTRAKNLAAYAAWSTQYAAFINEMEGQFSVIERHWRRLLPNAADIGSLVRKQSDAIDTQRQKLLEQHRAEGDAMLHWKCDLYSERVASQKNNLEAVLSDRVAIVRSGPS